MAGKDHQYVRQRKPDRADLLRPRRTGIQDAPGDVQVRFGITVEEDIAALEAPPGAAPKAIAREECEHAA